MSNIINLPQLSKIKRKPIEYVIDENGCHNCISHYKRWDGYHNLRDGKRIVKVHIYVYQLLNGKIPDGMVVMHKCDNPSCINPEHLMIGTHQDNMNDMKQKGRGSKCTRRLTVEERRGIADNKDNLKNQELADKYNIGVRTIRFIRAKRREGKL